MMKALILAAGEGTRLGASIKHEPKPLIRVLGVSLIERVIRTGKEAGIRQFVIVSGYLGGAIEANVGGGARLGVDIAHVRNEEWQRENGVSLLKAKDLLQEDYILLMSDHLFDGRILTELMKCRMTGAVVLAVDRKDPCEGDTKVLEDRGNIIDIGKDIEEWNCIDTGIFLCSMKMFSYAAETVEEGNTELADCIMKAANHGDAKIFDIGCIATYASKMRKDIKPWWIDIDTEKDLKKAKEMVIENASKNPSDVLARYVHRPIENRLVALISQFAISPNQLTIIVNILAYIVATLFFLGHLLPGVLLAFVVGIADGLDGKLARVKLKTSKVGSLEHSFDLLFEFSWFIALAWYLFRSMASYVPLLLCVFIVLFVAFYRHVYDQFRRAAGRSLDDAGDFERRFKLIAGRRNLYNIPILVSVVLGVPLYSLVFIVIHSGITAIIYSWRAIKHLYVLDRAEA
jgi:CDP-L-myo-inositol myo-inositolphosphotransferase